MEWSADGSLIVQEAILRNNEHLAQCLDDGSLMVQEATLRNDKYLAQCLGAGRGTMAATEEVDKDHQQQTPDKNNNNKQNNNIEEEEKSSVTYTCTKANCTTKLNNIPTSLQQTGVNKDAS